MQSAGHGGTIKREQWHATLLELLADLSDTEAQKAAWVGRRLGAFLSPVELLCGLFDDTGIDKLLSRGQAFSPTVDDLLRKMSSMAAQVNLDQPAEQLLKDLNWQELTKLAGKVRTSIDGMLEG